MNFKLLLAALAVASAPMTADALTLKLSNSSGTLDIVDGDGNDSDADANHIAFTGSIAGSDIGIVATISSDASGESILSLDVIATSAGLSDLTISASDTGFGEGAGNPTTAVFTMNASRIRGGTIDGAGYVDDGNGLFATTTLVDSGTLAVTSDDIDGSVSVALADPFSMTIVTVIKAGTTASYDATLITTPVPVPAGILLMGTALAGFGVMRRRKKVA
jgi:hypothetical protein